MSWCEVVAEWTCVRCWVGLGVRPLLHLHFRPFSLIIIFKH
uniref:Uncharacterized protein n=1 Tax=Heterorhabditis bacteriophora TaxID=37862 RepID=A0A1I7W618_HETBA